MTSGLHHEPTDEAGVDRAGAFDAVDLPDADAGIEPLCADVETWVEHVYAPVYIRKISQTQRWCPQWWAHAEAIVRLSALWRTWEAARAADDDAALADWLRIYLDVLNPVLLSADGPFASCTADRHSDQRPLPLVASPPGWWTDDQ